MYDSYDSYDIGNDGVIQTDNVNRLFAHDGYASSIQYYQGDYTPVSGNNYFNELSHDAIPLYNGNISALSESVYNLGEKGFLKLFRYDKLNRIKRMRTAAHHQNNPGWETASNNFASDYSYDWNGNLLFLHRKNQFGQEMHNIRYTYSNGNNRLGSINSTGIASSSYQYDAIGNLVCDNAEGLVVGWNAMGKVDTIFRNGSLLSSFRYSPTGQRQVKTDSSGTTLYIHDATGNVMCVYRQDGDTLRATERYLYGSKRLGMLEQQVWITANSTGLQDSNTIGVRVYELSDHLGNVTYTAQDRKCLVQDSYGQRQFIPSAITHTDYYPFGYPMPDRSYNNGGYRYFFNGQESDNEVYGEGALHAFEFRMHDTRIGRFWSVDPLAGKFPWWSTYQFAGLMPTWYGELEGLEPDCNGSYNGQGAHAPILDENNNPLPNTENQAWIWNNGIWNKAEVAVVYETMKSVFTRANPRYLKNVEIAINLQGSSFGLDSYESICHFLSQVGHESSGFTKVEESFNYSVDGLVSTFGKYFYVGTPVKGKKDAALYGRTKDQSAKEEEIANIVYGNRMDNGAKEGYLYRGRGLLQLTGKSAYRGFTEYINATFANNTDDFVKSPELVKTDQYMVLSAMWFFKKHVVDKIDVNDASVREVTKIINGGYNGLKDRESKYEQLKSVLK